MATINTDIAKKIDIIARENNSTLINIDIKDKDGNAFDLTGYTVDFVIYNDDDGVLLYLTNSTGAFYGGAIAGFAGITRTDGQLQLDDSGKLIINIESNEISKLNPGNYKHRLVLKKGVGIGFLAQITEKTWMYGKFKLNKD